MASGPHVWSLIITSYFFCVDANLTAILKASGYRSPSLVSGDNENFQSCCLNVASLLGARYRPIRNKLPLRESMIADIILMRISHQLGNGVRGFTAFDVLFLGRKLRIVNRLQRKISDDRTLNLRPISLRRATRFVANSPLLFIF